jgi:hypothetical protein
MVWLNDQEKTETLVVSITRVASSKGFVLNGVDFDCFLWNSDELLQQLLIALSAWSDTGCGKVLEIVSDKSLKRGFICRPLLDPKGKPLAEHWRITDRGFTTTEVEVEKTDVNPFL